MPFVPDKPASRFVPDAEAQTDSAAATAWKNSAAGRALPPLPGSAEEAEQKRNSKPFSAAAESPLDEAKRVVKSVAGPAVAGVGAGGELALSGATNIGASAANLLNAATGATAAFKRPGESDADFYRRSRAENAYQPRTEGGKVLAASPIPQTIGKVVEQGGNELGNLTGSPAAGELAKDVFTVGTAVMPGLRGGAAETPKVAPNLTVPENPVAAARAAGYKVRPSDVAKTEPETSVKTTTEAERLAGSDELRKSLMAHNQKNSTKMGLQELGLPETEPRITPKLIDQASAAPLAKYREVGRAAGDFTPSDEFHADLDATANKEGLHPDSRADIAKMVDEYKGREMSGPDSVKSVSVLRRGASRYLRSDDPAKQDFGVAQRQVADAIESQLTRQLEASGQTQLAQDFPVARQQLAKIHDVQTATKAGQLDIGVLNRMQKQGVPLTGRLKIMADTSEMFPHVTKHPQTISNVSGGGAVPGVGPVLDIASAGIRPLTRQFLKSDFYQNQLGKPTEIGPNSQLGDYFNAPPAPKSSPPRGPTLAPDSGPQGGVPPSQASAMLEAQKRAGNLSLEDEVRNPEQLPEAPSRLHAEIPPAIRGGIPFKPSAPDTSRAEGLSLADEFISGGIPGGQSPRAAGMSQYVPGTTVFPELRAVRGKELETPRGIEVQEHSGPVVTLHPSTKPGFFQVAVDGKPSHIVDAAGADDLVKNLNAMKLNTPIEPPNNVGSIMKKKGQVTPFAEKRGPLLGDQFTNNASGESAASAEAVSRVAQEKAAGQQRYRVNEDDTITPLTGVDAVDATAKKGQLIVQRGVGATKYTILDRGGHTADAARAKLNRAQKTLDEE